MKILLLFFFVSLFLFGCLNDRSKSTEVDSFIEQTTSNPKVNLALFSTIKTLDSLFFETAYNKCDTAVGRKLISKDFEFYHDKGGALLDEPEELAADIMVEDLSWICTDAHRKLLSKSMKIYPLNEGDQLYGVIQTGDHQFYSVENERPVELKITAKFIHLWIQEDDSWKLKRVFSFDHQNVTQN